MRRRAFLATAGSLLTAGCGALTGGGGGRNRRVNPDKLYASDRGVELQNRSDVSFSGMNESEFDFEDIDFDFNETALDGEFQQREWDFGQREEDRPTPTNERAVAEIRTALEKLGEAWDIYRRFAGRDASLLEVTPATEEIRAINVRGKVREAKGPLEAAAEHATGDGRVIVLGLQQIGVFLVQAAEADQALRDAYEEFVWATERLYAENTTQAQSAAFRLEDLVEEARAPYERLGDVESSTARLFEPLTADRLSEKIRRIESGIDAHETFVDGIHRAIDGLEHLQDGVPAYERREYEEAASTLLRARSDFGIATFSFEPYRPVPGITAKSQEVADVMRTLEAGTKALERSARGKVEDERLQYFEAQREAEKRFKSNEIVHRQMSTPREIIV